MESHLVVPRHGRIHRVWLAEESNEYRLVVEEESESDTWLLVYEWDAGWEVVAVFRMGYRGEYQDTIVPRGANIVDVGESMIEEQESIVVVEENAHGFWLVIYDWHLFWDEWALGIVYYVANYPYIYPELEDQRNHEELEDIDDDEDAVEPRFRRESTPSLSDNDYQDLEE
jgi:hypothetical protein